MNENYRHKSFSYCEILDIVVDKLIIVDTKFIQFPKNDIMPKSISGESILFELSSPYNPEKPLSRYWLQCHSCGLKGNIGSHTSVKIKNGLVTITPSIKCPECPAHYYIINGKVV